jgi:hypothetical protein
MRIDLYTKTILTIIALLLAVIALKPLIQPNAVAAQVNLSGVQFSGIPGGLTAVDTKSGEVWVYVDTPDAHEVQLIGKINQLGKPMVRTGK